MPKIKTVMDEVALATFLEAQSVPASVAEVFRNNSGALSVIYEDATADHGAVVYGTDDATGATAAAASYAAAVTAQDYTTRINTANCDRLFLHLTVVTAAAVTLKFGLRGTNLGDPDVDTATDWYRLLTDDKVSSSGVHTYNPIEGRIGSSEMSVTGGKYMLEFDVQHSNWVSLVFWDGGAAEFTVIAEAI
jgi:hypothetical protein